MKIILLLVFLQISRIIVSKLNKQRLKQKQRQIYQDYHNDFQQSQVQNSQIGQYQRSDPEIMVFDYNQKQRLKDSQYFFQPAYFNPLKLINEKRYNIDKKENCPFIFKNPFLDKDYYKQYNKEDKKQEEKMVVIGKMPFYSEIMQEYNKQQKNCDCAKSLTICDCDEIVELPLKVQTIVLPLMRPVYSINQKPKIMHNINKVGVETNYNQINELKVNNYIDGKKIQPSPKCKNSTNTNDNNNNNNQNQLRFKQLFHEINKKSGMTREQKQQCDEATGQEYIDLKDYVPPVTIITNIKDLEYLKSYDGKNQTLDFVTVIPKKLIQRIVPKNIYQQKLDHYVEDETITSVLNQAWDNTKKDAIKKNLYSKCKSKIFQQKIMQN